MLEFLTGAKVSIKRFASLSLCIVLLFSFTSCTDNSSDGLLPALGAGRAVANRGIESETEAPPEPLPDNGITICVDPGHGFDDAGAPSDFLGGLAEKDITLAVAQKLITHLEYLGFTVIVTHDGESFPISSQDNGNQKFDPMERTAYVNSIANTIDYYVSVHCNSYDSADVSGAKVYYYEYANADGSIPITDTVNAAQSIRDSLEEAFPDASKPSCDIENFYVIKYTQMPSALVEIGFLTNEEDSKNMLDGEWQDAMALAIANGINNFFTADTDE